MLVVRTKKNADEFVRSICGKHVELATRQYSKRNTESNLSLPLDTHKSTIILHKELTDTSLNRFSHSASWPREDE